jgi:hypothetical protein
VITVPEGGEVRLPRYGYERDADGVENPDWVGPIAGGHRDLPVDAWGVAARVRWVTRRTLTSVLARLRNISF